ncbi:MAG: acetoin dehydrogenase dihydrolipoyllysine-residue acetyltransferase subunit [Alphaproteobacteria bacterium]|nr:acetoin dehydrogenase dihydrolipoyllysine-residue acetyltransferase subunit [Alphaproteobacteria bacterium]
MNAVTQVKLPMPRLGETMEQGTISNWLVKPGDDFARGDPLLELETDKTLVEYPALGSGKLIETLVEPGDVVDVGAPIAIIETPDVWDSVADAPEADAPIEELPAVSTVPDTVISNPQAAGDKLRATPLARRLARQGGIDLSALNGTGRRGRVEARDVQSRLEAGTSLLSSARINRTGANDLSTVIFIHGFAGLGSNWAALRSNLQKAGLKTVAPDMPGHGQNSAEANGAEDCIAWLEALLNEQDGPVHLVGHSLGAHVAALAADRARSKTGRLTLVAPAGCGHEINGDFLQGMAHAHSAGELAHLLRLLGPKASKLPSDAMETMSNELSRGRLITLANAVARGNMQCIDTISAAAALSQEIPVTAIFGTADMIIPKEHMFNMPPRVSSHIVRTGHMPQWDSPALLEKLILQTN